MKEIRPQKGFQEAALSNPADIVIMGGSAGCGKTMTLLMENARHVRNPGFGAVTFRRTTPQISSEGGLWDTSLQMYPTLSGIPIESRYRWKFPSGASIKFSHLEFDKNVLDWQGSQIPLIGFDELTHFSYYQFSYMMSRNRSDCGIRPYVRATCNPDPDSWVKGFIEWWLDPITGYPIKERAGKVRWQTADKDSIVWGDTAQEVIDQCPHIFNNDALRSSGVEISDLIKSVSFVPGSILEDNRLFIEKDPGYLGNLLSLPDAEKSQLLDGCWKIRLDGLGLFEYPAIEAIFSNYPEEGMNPLKCITCDAARFGRDFCVIKVWKGFEVIDMTIFVKSDVHDIVNRIEFLRRRFNVMRSNVVIDQDGVGDDAVKLGMYAGFHGNAHPLKDEETRIKENYKNLKTQCYYRFAKRVNNGGVRYNLTNGNCTIFEDGKLNGRQGLTFKVKGRVVDVRDLIKEDFKAIKRAGIDMDMKLQINPKDEQKNILGRSPDFADTGMMREYIELRPKEKTVTYHN